MKMRRYGGVFLGLLLAVRLAGAQVPNEMYMQGVFLQSNGIDPAPGAHSVTAAVYANPPSVALSVATIARPRGMRKLRA